MLNYEIFPDLLTSYLPTGTELDFFNGRTFISLVGFRFLHTKLFSFLPLPFDTDFDEVNLRFYVRRQHGATIRRGVVFIREIVPSAAIARLGRLVYGENYTSHPMRHSIARNGADLCAEYQWKFNGQCCSLRAKASGPPAHPPEGSLEQFITEHYWGYTARSNARTLEYHVTHAPWRVWTGNAATFEVDAAALYGPAFATILQRPLASAFIADGSPVQVSTGRRIT